MRFISLVFLGGLVVISGLSANANAAKTAPDFTLKNLNGKNIRLSETCKTGPVLLSFWSTWCKNCPTEMKHYQRFADKYAKQGLTVLAISIDTNKTLSKVRPWIKGRGFRFPVLLDTNNNVKQLYRVRPVPHTFLIDRLGRIAYTHVGYRPGDELAVEKEILKALQDDPSSGNAADTNSIDTNSADANSADTNSTDMNSTDTDPAETNPAGGTKKASHMDDTGGIR
ncbi:MAG: TlpA family protein disulfide reductase [Candidatus Eisenbacteria sp.]|nr:TlpA family protein disulfide reductase [Candidatus Eisenbacteria bacterium]